MPESIIGHLPIRPHLLRYVEWREGLPPGQALAVPGPSIIAVTLNLILVSKTNMLLSGRCRDAKLAQCSARLRYQVTGRRYWRDHIFVADDSALAFGDFLTALLHQDLLDLIIAGQRERRLEKDVIVQFMLDTGLDDFIEFDALKQAQFRYRRKIGFVHHRGNQPAGYQLCRQPLQYERRKPKNIPPTLF